MKKTRILSMLVLLMTVATGAWAQEPKRYTVTMKDGTEDADKWKAKAGENDYQSLPLENVTKGTTVTVKYEGTLEVKSVKAVKKASGPVAYKECPDGRHPHWIDLGLPSGTHWQCCNEGATAPEEYGSYYSYDDAQSYNPPTQGQIQELLDGTTSEWTMQNGVNGRMFTGANGGKVFLPAAGDRQEGELNNVGSDGYYWSSTLTENPNRAYDLYFFSDAAYWSYDLRGYGQSVRPVRKN